MRSFDCGGSADPGWRPVGRIVESSEGAGPILWDGDASRTSGALMVMEASRVALTVSVVRTESHVPGAVR